MTGRWWLAVLLVSAACSLNEHGPWLTAEGVRLENSQVLEFEGSRNCDQQSVTFLVFFGNQYAKDPRAALGPLESVDGEGRRLEFSELDSLPPGAEPTGVNHENDGVKREIWLVEGERDDYIYMAHTDQTIERWPRFEGRCR